MPKIYNIAAIPEDPDFLHLCYEASAHFQPLATTYCLNKETSLPHATVCLFDAEDDNEALNLVGNYINASFDVTPKGISIKPFQDSFWVEYTLLRTPDLLKLHNQIVNILRSKNIKIYNPYNDEYDPHFTLARIKVNEVTLPIDLTNAKQIATPIHCSLKLGLSDSNWQFAKTVE